MLLQVAVVLTRAKTATHKRGCRTRRVNEEMAKEEEDDDDFDNDLRRLVTDDDCSTAMEVSAMVDFAIAVGVIPIPWPKI